MIERFSLGAALAISFATFPAYTVRLNYNDDPGALAVHKYAISAASLVVRDGQIRLLTIDNKHSWNEWDPQRGKHVGRSGTNLWMLEQQLQRQQRDKVFADLFATIQLRGTSRRQGWSWNGKWFIDRQIVDSQYVTTVYDWMPWRLAGHFPNSLVCPLVTIDSDSPERTPVWVRDPRTYGIAGIILGNPSTAGPQDTLDLSFLDLSEDTLNRVKLDIHLQPDESILAAYKDGNRLLLIAGPRPSDLVVKKVRLNPKPKPLTIYHYQLNPPMRMARIAMNIPSIQGTALIAATITWDNGPMVCAWLATPLRHDDVLKEREKYYRGEDSNDHEGQRPTKSVLWLWRGGREEIIPQPALLRTVSMFSEVGERHEILFSRDNKLLLINDGRTWCVEYSKPESAIRALPGMPSQQKIREVRQAAKTPEELTRQLKDLHMHAHDFLGFLSDDEIVVLTTRGQVEVYNIRSGQRRLSFTVMSPLSN